MDDLFQQPQPPVDAPAMAPPPPVEVPPRIKAIKAWPWQCRFPFYLDPKAVVNYWPSGLDGYIQLKMSHSSDLGLLLLYGTVLDFDRIIGRALTTQLDHHGRRIA